MKQLTFQELLERTSLSKEEILAHSYGKLVIDPPDQFIRLPAPPMLMIDRLVSIERGASKGKMVAEKDIRVDDWFFPCHFVGDPVQPGCLGVDAVWQLIGLYLAMSGPAKTGRALGCGEVEFMGQIRPHNKLIRYEIDIRRYTVMADKGVSLALGTGRVYVDDEHIYTIKDAKVGGFGDIAYSDYPLESEKSTGGLMER
jgi:3-hydroxyacyl-[acyl-carrier protein] dehydratase/trans-2-decenoyl-[acyl-carrier protein] isomerase